MKITHGAMNWFDQILPWRKSALHKKLSDKVRHVLPTYVRPWYSLSAKQCSFLESWTVDFALRKNWEGCRGLRLDDNIKLAVAGQVGLMVMGWEKPFYFDHVKSILVYPNAFVAPRHIPVGAGMHIETEQALEGQAWYRGPVIVSWSDVVEPNRVTPHNLVVHEFAHQIDMMNGEPADGLPPLPSFDRIDRWRKVMAETMHALRTACRECLPTVLDCYGRSSPSELFAVGCEAFFEAGVHLAQQYPEFYAELSEFYQLDTRYWHTGNNLV